MQAEVEVYDVLWVKLGCDNQNVVTNILERGISARTDIFGQDLSKAAKTSWSGYVKCCNNWLKCSENVRAEVSGVLQFLMFCDKR